MKNIRIDGCLLGPPSERDFRTVFPDRNVPDKVDLRPHCSPVEDQGQIGSCAANASVGALEYLYCRRDGRSPDLSRLFVYYNARRMVGCENEDSGAHIRQVMASILAFGACREDMWPYDPARFTQQPSPECYSEAQKYEAIQYARVEGGQGAIPALAQGFPVVFATYIPMRCFEEAKTTGVIPPLTEEERRTQAASGHAMLIVGYDKNERAYLVRNSWGESWGDRGYCKIPFEVMDACSYPDHFWIVAELEKPGNFTLIRPGKDSAGRSPGKPPVAQLGGMGSMASKLRDEIRSSLENQLSSSSRKIDELLSGGKRAPKAGVCSNCGGNGACPYCHGSGGSCNHCTGGKCWVCGGSGLA